MKIRPLFLHIDDIQSRKIIYAPKGTLYNKIIMCWEDNDRPFPWLANKKYEFDYDGTYTLGEYPEKSGNYIMLWKPEITINEAQHIKDKEVEMIIPVLKEGQGLSHPTLEYSVTLDPKKEMHEVEKENPETGEIEKVEEWDGTIGYNIVKIMAKYNEAMFPVNWGETAKIHENRWIVQDNHVNYRKTWRTWSSEVINFVYEYYCGVDFSMTIQVEITKINKQPISDFVFRPAGVTIVKPNETAIWIEKDRNLIGHDCYKIRAYHRGKSETTPAIKANGLGYILSRLDLWPLPGAAESFHLNVSGGGDKHLVEVVGSNDDVTQELNMSLDWDFFYMKLSWRDPNPPVPDPDPDPKPDKEEE